ncbi:hypothetical protein BT63DRAFT_460433 [Microthyrium microscopicum]|uniref:Uncharacterized protein n=1 Tax=Microthyrium microscopicum TaxID=703497 RepID=A0A6A6TWM2_9PEZI|nr:hypothetical protein BT63DRAFT_460433 [Microthyrium microscopicum]
MFNDCKCPNDPIKHLQGTFSKFPVLSVDMMSLDESQLVGRNSVYETLQQFELRTPPPPNLSFFSNPLENIRECKKKFAFYWSCCACGHNSISVQVNPCPACGTSRCARCPTQKVIVKSPFLSDFV